MRPAPLFPVLGWLVLLPLTAGGVDYDAIDRSIGREPAYKSKPA